MDDVTPDRAGLRGLTVLVSANVGSGGEAKQAERREAEGPAFCHNFSCWWEIKGAARFDGGRVCEDVMFAEGKVCVCVWGGCF